MPAESCHVLRPSLKLLSCTCFAVMMHAGHSESPLNLSDGPAPKRRALEALRKPHHSPKAVTVPCNFCRARQIKCDGARPACSSCVRRTLSCSYATDRRGGGKAFLMLQRILLHNQSPGLLMKDLTWMPNLVATSDKTLLQELADLLQLELDHRRYFNSLIYRGDLSRETVDRRCLRALRYLANNYLILPSSLTITEIQLNGNHPVAGGGFADIWHGSVGDQAVCLKVLRLIIEPDEEMRKNIQKRFFNEALIWKQLKHPNVLPLLGVNVDLFSPSFCLISPWMENKDIITYLKHHPLHNRQTVFSEIASGLCYIHSKITHGDIRGANILVTDELHCCIADFGLALTTSDSQAWSTATTGVTKGAIRWMAPELLSTEGLIDEIFKSPSRDIFALGCTMVEILTLQVPFHNQKTDYSVLACLMNCMRPARPDNAWCSDAIWALITRCWAQEPSGRPNAQEVYEALQKCKALPVMP
ncbi:hypothetical protein GYMLUDRAFT_46068 [Collybiopsis luxurians FD-317 M1]|uniref:Uncharacterized protein n=1 Tax=Collybiopsis luxurians FD-317 M1 TaxID=944289 RepID=A0A0D0BQQ7_9AGAR|nr:hypothetical protein GYMLUDRAFT_46068 [Collybiopsis luxurians FD-317 M1]